MENLTIELISNKLKLLPETQFKDIMDYIDFLSYKQKGEFSLSANQIQVLEESRKIPIDNCKSAKNTIIEIREKYK